MRLKPRIKNSLSIDEFLLNSMVKNSGQKFPAIFYGRHMSDGIAEYSDGPNNQPYKIFISQDTAVKMDPTFSGKPVYVDHVDAEEPNAENKTIEGVTKDDKGNTEKKIADGYVIESFFCMADGMHWVKFIITSEEGIRAIENGYKLSNCYTPTNLGPGGEWHGTSYVREFTDAQYQHLALVKNPRYRESVIMTPEEFKLYNEQKLKEIASVRNSDDVQKKNSVVIKFLEGASPMKSIMDMLFGSKNGKLEKVENAAEIGKLTVNMGDGRKTTINDLVLKASKMNDEDFKKLQLDMAERPEHNDDDDESMEEVGEKKKDAFDDEHRRGNDDEEEEEMKEKPNSKKNKKNKKNEDMDEELENEDLEERTEEEAEGKKDKLNKSKKNKDMEEEHENSDEFEGRGKDGEQDFVENDDDEEGVLKHVIMLDDDETTVGDMIKDHLDLKNRFNTLRQKHNALKEEYSNMCNKYGNDEDYDNDIEVPEGDAEAQEALGRMEDEEAALEKSLDRRKNAINKFLGRMKNAKEAVEKREQKLAAGRANFDRLANAEQVAIMNSKELPVMPTSTSSSMVERGRERYGKRD